ncbi:alanine racemase [Gallaecimonas xiamenensis]|uniref:Alanine racemase n=1 Tax=Gallaecimonas xiamenensis 3-C-1 TaxID=745411 RepID=K2K905_9GAMM|nr:alanine racemase [Gallaecimonas xiamenensis]EKE73765.1 alanine racemase [Gallaecimonas xiamenensis 3-C-1]
MKVATAVIDTKALRHNFGVVRRHAPQAKVIAVLKANGYGHNQVTVAKALGDADAFAVARLNEALALRAAGITQPLVMLEGCFNASDLPVMASEGVQAVFHTPQQLDMLKAVAMPRPLKAWIKVDTGMHRIGLAPAEVPAYLEALKATGKVEAQVGLISHFACADEAGHPLNQAQIDNFLPLARHWPGPCSMSASAAILSLPAAHFDWVRPGIMLYGACPMDGREARDFDLKPVMRLVSSLIAVKPLKAGETVGYGATWAAQQDTVIGVVAMGYGDGYPRHAKTGTPVFVNGRRVPLVGRVSMDMITVDLGPAAAEQVGDEVELWGPRVPVEEVAQHAGTISYELLCNIAQRVKYEFV